METVLILVAWLFVAFVIGILFGKFCAAGNAFDVQILSYLGIESDTFVEDSTPAEHPIEEAA